MKVLLINGAQTFGHSGGRLNDTLHDIANKTLIEWGHETQQTIIALGYTETDEVAKILWADTIIYQMPGWWMGVPWKVKRYLDDVFTAGHGSLYLSDGRTREDVSKQYGSGGLLHGKHYMLSVTWNAPVEAFNKFGNFFDGRGVDGVYFPFHKSQQFVGLNALPTFMVNDVIKAPQVDNYITAYRNHLESVIGRVN